MNSRQRDNQIPPYIFLVIIAGFLMIADTRNWLDPVRRHIESAVLRIRTAGPENPQETTQRLTAENAAIKKERDDLAEENELLRTQLQAPLPPQLDFTPARVISVEQAEGTMNMRIAAGSDNGIAKGMPVVIESIFIGVVQQVTPRITTIRLSASPDSVISVRTESGATGLVTGIAQDASMFTRAQLEHVLQTDTVTDGEQVVTSGDGGIPAGLLVGTAGAILSDAGEPFQRAEILLSADPKQLRKVFVVTKW